MSESGLGPPRIHKAQALLGILFLAITGWELVDRVPDLPKFVLILAPHTSNWDLPFSLAVVYGLGLKINWFGKKEAFSWPIGCVFKWLGGIPIDRSSRQNVVQQTAQTINEREQVVIGITPEGTRSKARQWSTGFYYIASLAKVPIVLGYLDYEHKVGGLGPAIYTTGNIEADMRVIREFYSGKTPKHSDKVGEMIVNQDTRFSSDDQDS